jgi:WD40 repeat protein
LPIVKKWKRFQIALVGVNLVAAAIGAAVLGKPQAKPERRHQILEHRYWVCDVAFAPDGKMLAAVGGTLNGPGEAKLWDVATGRERRWLTVGAPSVQVVAFSPDSEKVALGTGDGVLHVYAPATGAELASWRAHQGAILGLAFAPDGKTLASSGFGQAVSLWNVETGKLKQTFQGRGPVVFSPDGQLLAVSNGKAYSIVLWDLTTGEERATLEKRCTYPGRLAFAPDGTTLASANFDETITLWDLPSARRRASLNGHTDLVHCTAFSPDGKLVASGSQDRTIKLWDVATGRELATLEGHTGPINAVAFSPDGKVLASGSYDKTIHLWEMSGIN